MSGSYMDKTNWSLFTFESGCNPYVAFTNRSRSNVLRWMKRRGYMVSKIKKGVYHVYDNYRLNELF